MRSNARHGSSLWPRRFSVGLDLNDSNVRLIVLSEARAPRLALRPARAYGRERLRIEHASCARISPGSLSSDQAIDVEAICRAIQATLPATMHFGPARRAWHGSLALPNTATTVGELSLADRYGGTTGQSGRYREMSGDRSAGIDDRLSRARAEQMLGFAERISGLDRAALSIDWQPGQSGDGSQLSIAVTHRGAIDARIEAARASGLVPDAIECASTAALRACRLHTHVTHAWPVARSSRAGNRANSERYPSSAQAALAIWFDTSAAHIWTLDSDGVACALTPFEGIPRAALHAALHHAASLDVNWVGACLAGDIDAAGGAEVGVVCSTAIGAPVRLFDPRTLSIDAAAAHRGDGFDAVAPAWLSSVQAPLWAVPFGLALRGLRPGSGQ